MQRMFGKHDIYGLKKSSFDSLMIYAGYVTSADDSEYEIWFRKSFEIVTIKQDMNHLHVTEMAVDYKMRNCLKYVEKLKEYFSV